MTKHQLEWENKPSPYAKQPYPTSGTGLFNRACDFLIAKRCYLNPNLNTEHICQCLMTNPKNLLKALKQHGFDSFPHFVNHHRIEAAKSMMAQEAFDIYTLEAIAEKSGFGTRQAFYNTFERLVGMKPACYRRVVKKQRPVLEPCSNEQYPVG